MTDELIWRVAGGSGDGIDSTSQNFARALMRSGLNIFTHRHYPSRIRGGHTYVEVRAADEEVTSRGDGYNFLVALGDSFARSQQGDEAYYGNEEVKPLEENLEDLRDGGVIVYDEGMVDTEDIENFDERVQENNWHVYPVDLRGLAKEHGREVMRNTAGVGATAALVGMELDEIETLMEERMDGEILEQNLTILQEAYDTVEEDFDHDHDVTVPKGEHDEKQVLVTGSHCIAYAAIDAGCRFVSGYPMTPWTDVFQILSQRFTELGGVSEQVEDEIAAASMAVGASHAGVKAMTGTSGGGFALMSEPLGLAEMTETPLVMVEAMRGGPSTGLPTKPEQGDLEHVLYTSQGDSTRAVFAPGNHREAYEQTRRAFELAWEYQTPVIVLYDQKLSGEYRSLPKSFFDRDTDSSLGTTLTEEEIEEAAHHASGKYNRYAYDSDSGPESVTPRTVPGQKGGRFLATGNEHNEQGHISEDPENRRKMHSRRLAKIDGIGDELAADDRERQTVEGADDADYGVLTFGSQQGTVFEAVNEFNERDDDQTVKALSVSEMQPLPSGTVEEFIESVDEVLVVEMNGSGQFKHHLQRELGRGDKLASLLKYTGNPFEPAEVIEGVEALIDGEHQTSSRTEFRPN